MKRKSSGTELNNIATVEHFKIPADDVNVNCDIPSPNFN